MDLFTSVVREVVGRLLPGLPGQGLPVLPGAPQPLPASSATWASASASSRAPSFSPASHLNTYPVPQGGPSSRPPLEAALRGEVSAQHIHNNIQVSGGRNSPTTVQIGSPGSPSAVISSPSSSAIGRVRHPVRLATRHNLLANLQPSLQPIDLLASEKAPSTPAALEAALYAWYDKVAPTYENREELMAVDQYVRATINHLKIADCKHVLEYHRHCASAANLGQYDPFTDGPIYALALALHITPNIGRGSNRFQREWPARGRDKKRKADPTSASDTASCDLSGHSGHTMAQCYTRHPELRKTKKEQKARADKDD